MFCQGIPGGPRSRDGLANDCLEGVKNPLKDNRGISNPKSLDMMETGSIWWASFTLICRCLSLQHFILPQLWAILQLIAGESILTEAICVPQ